MAFLGMALASTGHTMAQVPDATDDFDATITIRTDSTSFSLNLGLAEGAQDGFDATHDVEYPLLPPGEVPELIAYFPSDDDLFDRLSGDIRAPFSTGEKVWTLMMENTVTARVSAVIGSPIDGLALVLVLGEDATTSPSSDLSAGISMVIPAGTHELTVHAVWTQRPVPVLTGPDSTLSMTSIDLSARGSHDPEGDPVTISWVTSTGERAQGEDASFTFDTPGEGFITLTIKDGHGVVGRETVRIHVENREPVADVVLVGPVTVRTGESVVLSAAGSSDMDGKVKAYSFDLGDGRSTGFTSARIHETTFTVPGIYTITCLVRDDLEAVSSPVSLQVEVLNRAPVAIIDAPTNVLEGAGFELSAARSSDPDGTIIGHTWNLGDGNIREGVTVTHSYDSPGEYAISLVVEDDRGSITQVTRTLLVAGELMVTIHGAEGPLEEGTDVTLTVTVINDPGGLDTDVTGMQGYTITWDLDPDVDGDGDGVSDGDVDGTGVEETFTPHHSGLRGVVVSVTGPDGERGLGTWSLEVLNRPPEISCTFTTDGNENVISPEETVGMVLGDQARISISDSDSGDAGGTVYSAIIEDPEGVERSFSGTARTIDITPIGVGTHTIEVTAIDDDGDMDSISFSLDVTGPPPEITFIGLMDPRPLFLVGENVVLRSETEPDTGVHHTWYIDGSEIPESGMTGAMPTHVFADPGDHEVTLVVTGQDGQNDTGSITIRVGEPVRADMVVEGQLFAGGSVVFNASTSRGENLLHLWDLDSADGLRFIRGPETMQRTYETPGTYVISLKIVDMRGEVSFASRTIEIVPPPEGWKALDIGAEETVLSGEEGEVLRGEFTITDHGSVGTILLRTIMDTGLDSDLGREEKVVLTSGAPWSRSFYVVIPEGSDERFRFTVSVSDEDHPDATIDSEVFQVRNDSYKEERGLPVPGAFVVLLILATISGVLKLDPPSARPPRSQGR